MAYPAEYFLRRERLLPHQCRPATVAMLRTVGRMLVNIHGQHENQALLAPEKHVEYLDRLGGLLPVREVYEAAYRRYCDIRHQLKKWIWTKR